MNGKLIFRKFLVQVLYIFILEFVMYIVAHFIPNPTYMIVIGGFIIAVVIYVRRTKRDGPEDEYHSGTDADGLFDDIKYLFTGFSEFRAESVSGAAIAFILFLLDVLPNMGAIIESGQALIVIILTFLSYLIEYAVFFIVNAAIWLILFRQYHATRVKHPPV